MDTAELNGIERDAKGVKGPDGLYMMRVKPRTAFIQATRTTPARQWSYWDLEFEPGQWLACKDLDYARKVAESFGGRVIL